MTIYPPSKHINRMSVADKNQGKNMEYTDNDNEDKTQVLRELVCVTAYGGKGKIEEWSLERLVEATTAAVGGDTDSFPDFYKTVVSVFHEEIGKLKESSMRDEPSQNESSTQEQPSRGERVAGDEFLIVPVELAQLLGMDSTKTTMERLLQGMRKYIEEQGLADSDLIQCNEVMQDIFDADEIWKSDLEYYLRDIVKPEDTQSAEQAQLEGNTDQNLSQKKRSTTTAIPLVQQQEKKENGGQKEKRKINHPRMHLSKELAAIVGTNTMTKQQALQDVWKYIHENGLKDLVLKNTVHCDEALKKIMNNQSIVAPNEIMKYVNSHCKK